MIRFLSISILILLLTFDRAYSETIWAGKLYDYSSELSRKEGSAKEVLGSPSVMPNFGYTPCAWMPKATFGKNYEFVKVGFNKKINVEQITVDENYFYGAIYQILLIDENDGQHLVYENRTPKINSGSRITNIQIDRTPYKVAKLELRVNANVAYKGMQIDAIAVSDNRTPVNISVNAATDNSIQAKPENLGLGVNSEFPELGPVISQDGKTIYFTRYRHPGNIGDDKNQDVWKSTMDKDGKFPQAINLGEPINNKYHNFIISLSPDANSMLLGNIYLPDGGMKSGLSVSNYDGSNWGFPKPMYLNSINAGADLTYCLAANRKILLMSIDRDDSYGGNDIYVSFLINDSTWSEPQNLGPQINTAAGELSPFLAADMSALYFSSDGFPGYGQKDIFISRRLDSSWTNWSEPQNLGPKFNTSSWDAYFNIPASGKYAYYVSSAGSYGAEDIFRIELPNALKPNIVALVSGKVLNAKDNTPVDAKIVYELLKNGKESGIARSNPKTGEYQIALPAGEKYGFLAEAEGFLSINENIDLRGVDYYQEIYKDLYIVPAKKGATVRINNIFFEFAKYDLLTDSYPELNRIINFLRENQDFKIEISGHTDNVGSDRENKILSENRAAAVAKYIIDSGIESSRVVVKGYGKSKPIAPNDNDENRAKNRRVEFKLL
jgi:outer membrane protein OmpA-like peptidoglycan-associated protein